MRLPPPHRPLALTVIAGAALSAPAEPAWRRRAAAEGYLDPQALWIAEHYAAVASLEALLQEDRIRQLPQDVRDTLTHVGADVAGEPVGQCSCHPAAQQQGLW